MKPLSFPLSEQPSQPSSPTPELLSAIPHIWLSWNPAVPEQLNTLKEGTEGLPKKSCPPDQLNGWVRMFTQRAGNVHVSSAPLCPDIHTRSSCIRVYGYGMDGCGVSQGRAGQTAPSRLHLLSPPTHWICPISLTLYFPMSGETSGQHL